MKDELALRYLVLKVLARVPEIPARTQQEVSESLRIERDPTQFLLSWVLDGMKREITIPRAKFLWYQRGDDAGSREATGYDIQLQNFSGAADIVRTLLDRTEVTIARPQSEYFRSTERLRVTPGLWWLAPVAVVAVGGQLVVFLAIALAVSLIVERYAYRLMSVGGLIAIGAAWLGTPLGAAMLGVSLIVIAILSPAPQGRMLIATSGAAAIFSGSAAVFLSSTAPQLQTATDWLALMACIVALAIGWMFGTHHYMVPLVLPLVGLGLVYEGFGASALALAVGPMTMALWRAIHSVQNPTAPPSHPTLP